MPTLLGLLVGGALSQLLPREYVATATIAATRSTSSEINPPDSGAEARQRAVSDDLLNDALLQKVATEEHLTETAALVDVVAGLRSRTSISLAEPATSGGPAGQDILLLSYTAPTAELAERVANGLARAFVEQRSQIPNEQGERASTSLGRQLELSRDKLREAEQALRQAESSLPGSASERGEPRQAVDELRKRLKTATQATATERERLAALDQQIDATKKAAEEAAAAAEGRLRERVDALERKLAEARKQYTSQHPDVQRLELDLAQARADERAAYSEPPLSDDPVAVLIAERNATQQRVDELAAAAKRAEAELSRSETRIDSGSRIERRAATASREYDLARQAHQRLEEQYQQALRDETIEREQAGNRAFVLTPASRPEAPSSPNPTLVIGGCLLAGLALGVAWAVGRQLLDRSFYNGRVLEEKYGTPVLAEIPHF